MFIIDVCISEKTGKKYYKLNWLIPSGILDSEDKVFLTFDENTICTIADISPRKLTSLDVGSYDINLNVVKGA